MNSGPGDWLCRGLPLLSLVQEMHARHGFQGVEGDWRGPLLLWAVFGCCLVATHQLLIDGSELVGSRGLFFFCYYWHAASTLLLGVARGHDAVMLSFAEDPRLH
jgi:hypothetical protein